MKDRRPPYPSFVLEHAEAPYSPLNPVHHGSWGNGIRYLLEHDPTLTFVLGSLLGIVAWALLPSLRERRFLPFATFLDRTWGGWSS